MQRNRKVISEFCRKEELSLLLMGASQRNAVDLAVHDSVRKRFGGERNDVRLLVVHRQSAESSTVCLEGLAAFLINRIELHEALDEIRPARSTT